jgi:hypothetical protein
VITSLTGLSVKTVASIRQRSTEDIPQLNGRIGHEGKVRQLNTAHGKTGREPSGDNYEASFPWGGPGLT